jgi:hypothetical protein
MLVELIDYYESKIGVDRILDLLSGRTITTRYGAVSSAILEITVL